MDDIVDEEEEDGAQNGASQTRPPQTLMGRLHGLTGPVGEPGLPPSRPSSAATAKSGAYSQAASRRQHGSAAGSAGGAGKRPPSSASRTHVPSLTSSAFFRPMSSQRLQAQRNQRPMSNMAPTSAPGQDTNTTGFGAAGNRQSNGSETIIQGPPGVVGLHHDERPTSRGTDITDMPDRNTSNNSPEGGETFRSRGESEVPLSGPDIPSAKPMHLDLARPYRASASNLPPQKSPRSFRSSFALATRQSPMRSNTGHEKLESNPSTPRMSQGAVAAQKAEVMEELGKNYEYFTGNTVFFFGGRLQNARERPINLATGLAMVLPAALFLGFS